MIQPDIAIFWVDDGILSFRIDQVSALIHTKGQTKILMQSGEYLQINQPERQFKALLNTWHKLIYGRDLPPEDVEGPVTNKPI